MSRIFLISDTHFGQEKILRKEAEHRPFATIKEHDLALIENWNSVVNPKDTVWHLGDVLFCDSAFAYLPLLNGHKRLVMGNHDDFPIGMYAEHFEHIFGAAKLRDCILTHIPVSTCQFPKFRANIHGHKHSKKLKDPRYVCVSAEQISLTPITLEEVLARLEPQ